VADSTVYAGNGDDHLYALNAQTGQEQWRFKADGSVYSPAVADGTVYAGSRSGHLYALDAQTGREQWRFETDGSVYLPAVADGTVYAGSRDNHLYALDAQTGQEQWRFETDNAIAAPAVADGTVYAGSNDGNLYALGSGSGIGDKDQLITRVPFDEAPSSVKEKTRRFFQNSEPSVCFDTPKHASVYIVESIDEIRPIYFIWIFGCRKTRGRGSMGIFDGRSGNRIGNFFGYYITGSAGDVYVNTNSSSSYPELVIREEERKNVRLVFDESSGKYEYNTK